MTTNTLFTAPAATPWLAGGLQAGLRSLAARRAERRIRRDLEALDDRLLRDMGISRGLIAEVARTAARGPWPRPLL